MARVKCPITVLGPDGRPLAGATVTTRTRPGGVVAPAFATEIGGAPANNPATTGADGRVVQWFERGAYASTCGHASISTFVDEWEAAPAGDSSVTRPWLNLVNGVGLFRDRPAASRALAEATYVATDTGTTYICDATPAWVLVSARPLDVTVLPASPVDGQEIIYRGTGAPSIGWHFRYYAASASPYKWEAVSFGTELVSAATRDLLTLTASAWQRDIASARYTLPLAGDWNMSVQVDQLQVIANTEGRCRVWTAGVDHVSHPQVLVNSRGTAIVGTSLRAEADVLARTAATVVELRIWGSTANGATVIGSKLGIRPLRVG